MGGFETGALSVDEQRPLEQVTTLDGMTEDESDSVDIVVHHATGDGFDIDSPGGARLSGFTVTGGARGGIVEQGTSYYARGAGILVEGERAWLRVDRCIIRGNRSSDYGGGLAVDDGGHLTVMNSVIRDNSADYGGGAALLTFGSNATRLEVINCTFFDNVSPSDETAGIYISSDATTETTPRILNTIFADLNRREFAAEIADPGRHAQLLSNLFVGADPPPGESNFREDSPFVAEGDLHLSSTSGAIGAGEVCPAPPIDLEGRPRTRSSGSSVDIGAYQHPSESADGVDTWLENCCLPVYPEGARMGPYFRFCDRPRSWITARETCKDHGGRLAAITDVDNEINSLVEAASRSELAGAWTDGVTWLQNGEPLGWGWTTIDEAWPTGDLDWASGCSTSGSTTRRCLTFILPGQEWCEERCDAPRPFFCEVPEPSEW